MSSYDCIVAADVGNSRIKLCVRRSHTSDDASLLDHSIPIDDSSWHCDALAWVREQLGCGSAQWRIASVDRSAVGELQQAIAENADDASIEHATRHDVPLKTLVAQPDHLGIDRLLNAYAASNRFSPPLIVIDAGSAVTVDYVSVQSELVGGAILPGLAMQLRALATGTDALPHVSWESTEPLATPGRDTVEAIRLGVLMGLAGAIERLVARYREMPAGSSQNCQVVVTGGDAATLSPLLRFPHEIVANLVCRGLLDLPRSGDPETNGAAGIK